MSDDYFPAKGDLARVVLEGEVTGVFNNSFAIGLTQHSNVIYPYAQHVISVEKLAPQLPTKQGSMIRIDGHSLVLLVSNFWVKDDGTSYFPRDLDGKHFTVVPIEEVG